jgi:enoyl-CoA hydratase/carnithine racemase
MAFGGGCEFQMHTARTVAALESYIGLVEAGVGLLPAGGGLKELALRASQAAVGGDVFTQLKGVFETVAMAKVSASALEAKEMGLLRASDVVVFHADELCRGAGRTGRVGWRPAEPANSRRRRRHGSWRQSRQHRRAFHARYGIADPHRRTLCGGLSSAARRSTNSGCSDWTPARARTMLGQGAHHTFTAREIDEEPEERARRKASLLRPSQPHP